MRLVSYEEIKQLIRIEDTVEPVRRSFQSYSSGKANIPGVQHLEMPHRQGGALHIKTGHVEPLSFCLVKVASTFPENVRQSPARPSINGAILVFSAEDGEPLAVLEDRAWITQARTAGAGAVAASLLARKDSGTLGVIGSGVQARLQASAVLHVVPSLRRVLVWGRTASRAERYAGDLRAEHPGIEVASARTAESVARHADILVTATFSSEPLVRGAWLPPGVLVIGMGADSPHKLELDTQAILDADRVIVDSRAQNEILAELGHGIRHRHFDASRIDAEIGEVLLENGKGGAASGRGRTSPQQRIICKLTGVAVQEIFVCEHLLRQLGITRRVHATAGEPTPLAALA